MNRSFCFLFSLPRPARSCPRFYHYWDRSLPDSFFPSAALQVAVNQLFRKVFPRFPCQPVVDFPFDLELHSVPAPSVIPHIVNQRTISLVGFPCEVFRGGLQFFLEVQRFRYCQSGCPSDAVNVYTLNNIAALGDEHLGLPAQYCKRSLGVCTPLFLPFYILDTQPDLVPHFAFCIPTPHSAIKSFSRTIPAPFSVVPGCAPQLMPY